MRTIKAPNIGAAKINVLEMSSDAELIAAVQGACLGLAKFRSVVRQRKRVLFDGTIAGGRHDGMPVVAVLRLDSKTGAVRSLELLINTKRSSTK